MDASLIVSGPTSLPLKLDEDQPSRPRLVKSGLKEAVQRARHSTFEMTNQSCQTRPVDPAISQFAAETSASKGIRNSNFRILRFKTLIAISWRTMVCAWLAVSLR
jgi:hypothetical protein